MFGLGATEFVIVAVVAVLLFGKNLPEVAKSLGASYKQFREGLNDIQRSIEIPDTPRSSTSYSSYHDEVADDYEQPTAPKFELPAEENASE
ncbi:MAG: twin-arginine translocase TatA/TatE family subunit [Planctomycetales bacterium]|nr:twin-arginine translocase TatA/TatE family subunit [Planctomycetales bacterium]